MPHPNTRQTDAYPYAARLGRADSWRMSQANPALPLDYRSLCLKRADALSCSKVQCGSIYIIVQGQTPCQYGTALAWISTVHLSPATSMKSGEDNLLTLGDHKVTVKCQTGISIDWKEEKVHDQSRGNYSSRTDAEKKDTSICIQFPDDFRYNKVLTIRHVPYTDSWCFAAYSHQPCGTAQAS